MTTTPRSSARTTQRQALVMIAYTFALALGAAVPFAVSFAQDARPATQRRVRCGGYRELSAPAPEAPATSSDRPRTPAATEVSTSALRGPRAALRLDAAPVVEQASAARLELPDRNTREPSHSDNARDLDGLRA